jgi:hypothetical protein
MLTEPLRARTCALTPQPGTTPEQKAAPCQAESGNGSTIFQYLPRKGVKRSLQDKRMAEGSLLTDMDAGLSMYRINYQPWSLSKRF